jgi:lipid A 3-O-deacylase
MRLAALPARGISVRIGGVGLAALALALLAAPSARADGPDLIAGGDGRDLIAGGIGVYDVLHNNTAAQLRGEYRFGYSLFFLEPLLGALVTSDGSFYGYGGLRADLIIAQHYVIMPVATVGYWSRGGGKNLGAATEFKTGAEFAYRFADASRLGIAFDHISNAGIGRKNPGTESLLLVYSLPLQRLLTGR